MDNDDYTDEEKCENSLKKCIELANLTLYPTRDISLENWYISNCLSQFRQCLNNEE